VNYDGWRAAWRRSVLVGEAPTGRRASIGEVFRRGAIVHAELVHPDTGARLRSTRVASVLEARNAVAAMFVAEGGAPVAAVTSLLDQLVEEVRRNPGCSASAIAPALGVTSRHASRIASAAVRDGRLEETGNVGGRRLFYPTSMSDGERDPLADLLLLATTGPSYAGRLAALLRLAHRLGVLERANWEQIVDRYAPESS